jgi:hypothetical protein
MRSRPRLPGRPDTLRMAPRWEARASPGLSGWELVQHAVGESEPDTPGSPTGVSTGIYHVGARPDFPSSRRESLGVLGEKS